MEVWKNVEFKIFESFVYVNLENGGGFEFVFLISIFDWIWRKLCMDF